MSWYSGKLETPAVTDDWLFRVAVTIPNAAALATVDVEFAVPKDWDHFWDNVKAAGADIRFTDGDGRTLVLFDLVGFNASTRTLTVQLPAVVLKAVAGMFTIWMYYGCAAATTQTTAQVVATPVTAYIEVGEPTDRILALQPEAPGATRPRVTVAKTTTEELFLWLDVTKLLTKRPASRLYAGHRDLEEVWSAVVTVTLAGAAQAAMVVMTDQRFRYHRGRTYVRARIKGGTTATTYTGAVSIRTKVASGDNVHQVREGRFLISVNDASEV